MAKQPDPRLVQAMQLLARGQSQDAEALCDAVLADRKRDDLALALKAQACNTLGKYDDAMQSIKAAIAKNAKRADYHGLLGDMLTTKGDFRSAIVAYDKALKLNPNHHGVIAGKGEYLASTQRAPERRENSWRQLPKEKLQTSPFRLCMPRH